MRWIPKTRLAFDSGPVLQSDFRTELDKPRTSSRLRLFCSFSPFAERRFACLDIFLKVKLGMKLGGTTVSATLRWRRIIKIEAKLHICMLVFESFLGVEQLFHACFRFLIVPPPSFLSPLFAPPGFT